MQLNPEQLNAIEVLVDFITNSDKREFVLVGLAGTGKTTILPKVVEESQKRIKVKSILTGEDGNLNVEYTATTNKAAKVLAEKVKSTTKTIHSLLGLIVEENHKTGKTSLRRAKNYLPLRNTVLFIDEASMINLDLLKEIRNSTSDCKVIYIGDPYQLNPVFENSCPVFDWIKDQVRLTQIMRQTGDSLVPVLGGLYRHAVDTNNFPEILIDNKSIIHCNGNEFREAINNTFTETPTGSYNSKVLAWCNKRVHQYNDYIRSLYTSDSDYMIGEKVITNKPILGANSSIAYSTDDIATITGRVASRYEDIEGNFYTLDNGIRVFQANNQFDVSHKLKVLSNDKNWKEFFSIKNSFADLRPLHSCTVHKSQGSTYDKVFIDLDDIGKCNKNHEVARMMYVALTRTSGEVYLYGSLPNKYSGKGIEF